MKTAKKQTEPLVYAHEIDGAAEVAARYWGNRMCNVRLMFPTKQRKFEQAIIEQILAIWETRRAAAPSPWPEDVAPIVITCFPRPGFFLREAWEKADITPDPDRIDWGKTCIEMTVGFEKVWLRDDGQEKQLFGGAS